MSTRIPIRLSLLVGLACVCGCVGLRQENLRVLGGEKVAYQCESGDRIVVRYYSLSDSSLEFVKVFMPDGKEHTLPRALAASGVRYTDDFQLVWWTKGDSAFAETRDPNGQWQVKYRNCRQLSDMK